MILLILRVCSQVSAVKTEGGSTRRPVPISVLVAVLTVGSMCSVCRESVTQVQPTCHYSNTKKSLLIHCVKKKFKTFYIFQNMLKK